jgi:methylated-DNA-[protein]-cysteine S-methyltransferase
VSTTIEELLRRGAAGEGETAARLAQRVAEHAAEHGLAQLAYAQVDSPFGALLVAVDRRGRVVRLAFPEQPPDAVLEELARRVSPRLVNAPAQLDAVRRELEEYFGGRRRHFDVGVDWALTGTFARRVLRATAAIPYGRTLSYRDVAERAGSPRGMRAAGNALGANPIPIVVPCHRVVRTGGELGGYGGGTERKRFLLALESGD